MNRTTRQLTAFILTLLIPALLLAGCVGSANADQGRLPLGDVLYRLIVGGPEISEVTLIRFYAWHIVGLGIPVALLIAWHGFRVRRDGGVSSPVKGPDDPPFKRIDRGVIVRGETLTFFLTIAAMIVLSVFVDPPLGRAAETGVLVENTKAPWIFLWIQSLLRIWPPAVAGVLVPLLTIALLGALPFFDGSDEGVGRWFNQQGRLVQIILIVITIAVLALTLREALR